MTRKAPFCKGCAKRLRRCRRWKFDVPKTCTEDQVRQLLPPNASHLKYHYSDIPGRKTITISYWAGQWGKDGNGFFCSDACGFNWAVRAWAMEKVRKARKEL